MNTGSKFMAAGAATGAVIAGAPVVYGVLCNLKPKPIDENDKLHIENGAFYNANGVPVCLKGINLNDELFYFEKDGMDMPASNSDIFAVLEGRFGNYGARKLIRTYNENFITKDDFKLIKKLGADCVRVPVRYKNISRKENCRDIDFDYLDGVIETCRKLGLYVILDLHSAPGFQNNDSACGKDDSCILFDASRSAFDARNATVKLWTQIAAQYKDEPAIAAFDLLNRPLNKVAAWEEKLDALNKFYLRLYKAIQTVDPERLMIMQAPYSIKRLNVFEKNLKNAAYGIYSHFHTTFETNALVKEISAIKAKNIPVVICKLRSDENTDYSLSALCDCGASWLFGDYKGPCGSGCLYTCDVDAANFDTEKFDGISEKWSAPLLTKNFTLNKELNSILKAHFGYGSISVDSDKPRKTEKNVRMPKVKLSFGSNFVIGKNTVINRRKLKELSK